MQSAGVAAGPYLEPPRVFRDPQLREGGYFASQQSSDGEVHDLPGLGWRFAGVDAYSTAAPVLGMHNKYVYHDLLGMTPEDVGQLIEEQIIY